MSRYAIQLRTQRHSKRDARFRRRQFQRQRPTRDLFYAIIIIDSVEAFKVKVNLLSLPGGYLGSGGVNNLQK